MFRFVAWRYDLWTRLGSRSGRQRDFSERETNINAATSAGRFWAGLRKGVERRIAVLIVLLIERAILAGANPFHPVVVRLVPLDGLAEPVIQRDRRFPSEISLDFIAAQRVAAVMPRAIFDMTQ